VASLVKIGGGLQPVESSTRFVWQTGSLTDTQANWFYNLSNAAIAGDLNLQDWKMTDEVAKVENDGLAIDGRTFFSPANSGPSVSVLHFSSVLFRPSFSFPSISSPWFFCPSFSTRATSSVIFQSCMLVLKVFYEQINEWMNVCIIHSCGLVRQLAVRHFLPLRIRPSFAS